MLESVQGQVASIVWPNIAVGSPCLVIIEHFIQVNIQLPLCFLFLVLIFTLPEVCFCFCLLWFRVVDWRENSKVITYIIVKIKLDALYFISYHYIYLNALLKRFAKYCGLADWSLPTQLVINSVSKIGQR